jgi:hypothetical protein
MEASGPAGTAILLQNDCENLASRNVPNLAVALKWGMGSSSLNADVNAFERLQIVRGRNSSYFGSWAYVVDNISPLMWRRDLCGARLGNAPKDTLFGVDKRHITFRSETAKELHDAWVLAPDLSLVPFPAGVTGRQRLRFHLKIDFGVDIGGVDGNVSQPRPDCVDVYAST